MDQWSSIQRHIHIGHSPTGLSMTVDPLALYEWIARVGFPGSMAVLIWALYTRRLHWHQELEEIVRIITDTAAEKISYLEDRIKELATERNKLFEMIISSQRAAAKSMDALSELTKKEQ